MPRLTARPVLLLPVLAVAAAFMLTACGNGGVAEESQEHTVETGANGQAGDLKILDATITTGLTTTSGDLSLTVADQGQDGDALTGATSPQASAFVLPATLSGSSPDSVPSTSPSSATTGVSSTGATGTIAVPAGGVVEIDDLDAIVVSGLTGSPQVGDSVPVTFTFAGAGDLTLEVPVVGTSLPASSGTPSPAVTGANVDNGNPSPAVSNAGG